MSVATLPTAPLSTPSGAVGHHVFDRHVELGTTPHEQVVFCQDAATGLRAIIAIHDTTLGPALGGTRCYPYASEADALTDVLRLSHGMTMKAAAAGLPLGGGKAVIIGDPATATSPTALEAYGRFVDTLGGRYYTAADVGTTADDLDVVRRATPYVVGSNSGSGDSGYATAFGVFHAMRAAAEHAWGPAGLAGRTVGVEGAGKVGVHLVGLLIGAGASVQVTDVDAGARARLAELHPQARIVDSAVDADVDVYAPCALGATLTDDTVARLRATVVCGGANNQLATPAVADELRRRDVLWVPDFIANAGGLIQVGGELTSATRDQVLADTTRIAETVTDLLDLARRHDSTTSTAARTLVEQRLAAARA